MTWPTRHHKERGFTFVEIAVVAPIVILAIGAFITVIVSMTGEVLTSRASTQLLYNVQDALNRIDQDVKLSSTFLAETNIPLTSPQGYNDDTTAFDNVDATKGTMLVLNTLATTGNPLDASSSIAYLSNSPNACGSLQGQNTPMSLNVVYFVKNNTLWRRTIAPANYATAACNNTGTGTAAPWQQPSCSPTAYAIPSNSFCKTTDEDLVDASSITFDVQYFNGTGTNSENTVASDPSSSVANRNAALVSASTINASIEAHLTVAGKDVSQAASIRSTRLDTNASAIASAVAPTIPSVPVVSGSTPNINGTTGSSTDVTQTIFKWSPSTGGGTITYTLQYRINGGSWNTVNNIANSGTPSYTIPNASFGNVIDVQVKATNSAGTSAWSSTSEITVPIYAVPQFQSNWQNYPSLGYSGLPYTTVAYTRTNTGLVSLKGLVTGGSSYPSPIFTLPPGFAPADTQTFPVYAGGGAIGAVYVFPSGIVGLVVGSNAYVSLDNIRFYAAPPNGPNFNTLSAGAGWTNYGGGYANFSYAQSSTTKLVQIKGLLKGGSTGIIATLPAGIGPSEWGYVPQDANGGFGDTAISGSVEIVSGSSSYTSTQSLFYPNNAITWTPLSLQNSWVSYSAGYSTPSYTKNSEGFVSVKGMIRSGNVTTGTVIATLPANFRPKQEMIVLSDSIDQLARVEVYPNGNIVAVTVPSATWLSLDNINFPAEQ